GELGGGVRDRRPLGRQEAAAALRLVQRCVVARHARAAVGQPRLEARARDQAEPAPIECFAVRSPETPPGDLRATLQMPELPEVETIRRHLAPHVEGRTLRALEVLDDRWTRPLPGAEVAAAVQGRQVERLGRRGKYLIWELSDEAYLLQHLRMTGTLLLDPAGAPPYTRVWLRLDGHDLAYT